MLLLSILRNSSSNSDCCHRPLLPALVFGSRSSSLGGHIFSNFPRFPSIVLDKVRCFSVDNNNNKKGFYKNWVTQSTNSPPQLTDTSYVNDTLSLSLHCVVIRISFVCVCDRFCVFAFSFFCKVVIIGRVRLILVIELIVIAPISLLQQCLCMCHHFHLIGRP